MVEWKLCFLFNCYNSDGGCSLLQDKIRNDDKNKGNLMNILFQMQLKIMLSKLKEF